MAENRIFEEAISAIENGQRARARDLLTRLLRQDKTKPEYWLYMSAVVDSQKERIFCLENALKYDPENETALHGLVMAGAAPPDPTQTLVRPVNERQWEAGKIFGEDGSTQEKKPFTKIPLPQFIALIVVGVLGTGLILIGIFGNPFYKPANAGLANTRAPLITSGPTPTFIPTFTPLGGVPTENPYEPTPVFITVEETFTPTPRYVNTPHPNNEAYEAGIRSLDAENYGQAIALLEQARTQTAGTTQDDIDIRYYMALALMGQGDNEEAKRQLDLIILEKPAFAAAYTARAEAILAMRPKSNVAGDLYKAINLDTEYLEGYLAIVKYRLMNGELDEAQRVIESNILELDPDNALGHYYLAETLIGLEEPELALDEAQLAFENNPTLIDNYLTLGHALILNDRASEAYGLIELYLKYDENKENAMAWYLFGRAQQAYLKHEEAISSFERAYNIRKDIYEMSLYWAISLTEIEEYDLALERVQVPIERILRWFDPYQVKAEIFYLQGDYAKAKETIEDGADYARTDAQLAALYYWRGVIYRELGYPLIARENWEQLAEMDEDVVPEAWMSEALDELEIELPTATPDQPTPTRVPTLTPKP